MGEGGPNVVQISWRHLWTSSFLNHAGGKVESDKKDQSPEKSFEVIGRIGINLKSRQIKKLVHFTRKSFQFA